MHIIVLVLLSGAKGHFSYSLKMSQEGPEIVDAPYEYFHDSISSLRTGLLPGIERHVKFFINLDWVAQLIIDQFVIDQLVIGYIRSVKHIKKI